MMLPAPLRTARALALFQGWAAGLGVFVMLGVAVVAAGGLRNGAFVALALLFLAGDVLAVSTAVVIAARRLSEGAAWARLLLDVVEGVTIAVGLLAILMGTGALGVLGVVIGVTVIVCLHMPSSNALFDGQPLLPWEGPAREREPEAPMFPVPSLPRRTRSGMAWPLPPAASTPAPVPPQPRSAVAPPAWRAPIAPRTGPYSWERLPTPLAPPRPVEAAAAPPAPPVDPLPLITPPVVAPPDEPPSRPFVVPPLETIAEVPRHGTLPGAEAEVAPAIRPFVVPAPQEPALVEPAAVAETGPEAAPAPPAAEVAPEPAPSAAPAPPPAPAPAVPTPPAADRWEPRQLPPVAAATARPAAAPVTVYERRRVRTAAASARPGRSATPPPPSWAWRRVVIAASLLGAIGGGTLSAVELLAGGAGRAPATGQAPAPQPPQSGLLPGGGTNPAPPRPGGERSEPAAAGGVSAVTVSPDGCGGGSCTVTVRVDLQPHQDELVAWTLVVTDRCSSQRLEVPVTGVPAPASYRYVTSTNQVTVPGWRSPQIMAVTTSPARASSPPIAVGGSGC